MVPVPRKQVAISWAIDFIFNTSVIYDETRTYWIHNPFIQELTP